VGTVTDIAEAGVITVVGAEVTTVVGAGVADTITAGVITVASTETLIRLVLLSSIHCPDESRHRRYGRSRRQARPVQFSDAGQPSSISTAIRIRSEWFLAPSFCFSSEVVLATVL
jgi:hypothetical protein